LRIVDASIAVLLPKVSVSPKDRLPEKRPMDRMSTAILLEPFIYRIRFMLNTPGEWRYVTKSNVLELDGQQGKERR
jgi:hypothetical protein